MICQKMLELDIYSEDSTRHLHPPAQSSPALPTVRYWLPKSRDGHPLVQLMPCCEISQYLRVIKISVLLTVSLNISCAVFTAMTLKVPCLSLHPILEGTHVAPGVDAPSGQAAEVDGEVLA